jgi:hypothetical protein
LTYSLISYYFYHFPMWYLNSINPILKSFMWFKHWFIFATTIIILMEVKDLHPTWPIQHILRKAWWNNRQF